LRAKFTAIMNRMTELVASFPTQLAEAIHIGNKAALSIKKKYSHVYITGLGGSGIGASILQDIVAAELKIPITVSKHYQINASVDKDTLLIACSYSGDTEETLSAMMVALQKKATVVCISSGGAMLSIATKKKLPFIKIPGGMPPRACMGYSLVQQLFVLYYAGLISKSFEKELEAGIDLLLSEQKKIRVVAEKLCNKLLGKIPVFYTLQGYQAMAVRVCQQIQENSKMLCWHNVIPEMTHNEILGWSKKYESVLPVFIYSRHDYPFNIKRMKFLQKVIKNHQQPVAEILLKGDSLLVRILYLTHLSDWLSVLLAERQQIDAMDITTINQLKAYMSKK
jgi:bifunctional phosphoglucose/phosphomannose isomerase